MSGAPEGGFSKNAPLSAGDIVAVSFMKVFRKESSPAANRQKPQDQNSACIQLEKLIVLQDCQVAHCRHAMHPDRHNYLAASCQKVEVHTEAELLLMIAQCVQDADGATRIANGLLHIE